MQGEVVVNARFFIRQVNGVERYAREVTRRFKQPIVQQKPGRALQGVAGHFWEQVSLPTKVRQEDLLWSPANSGPLRIANQVVTIHDVSPIDHPEWFHPGFAAWYGYLLPRLARRVRKVITSSEFSKQRLMAVCGIPDEQVVVVPCGVDRDQFFPRTVEEVEKVCHTYEIKGDYFLFVGSLTARKNLGALLQAWKQFFPGRRDVSLVIVGSRGRVFRNRKGYSPLPGTRWLGYAADSDLPALYSGALGLIFPSHYEGFGLPILEAMSCGAPIIASGTTSIPEVTGSAAFLINPDEVKQIISAMVTIYSFPQLRQELLEQGLERSQMYSWERTAEAAWDVLEQARP